MRRHNTDPLISKDMAMPYSEDILKMHNLRQIQPTPVAEAMRPRLAGVRDKAMSVF